MDEVLESFVPGTTALNTCPLFRKCVMCMPALTSIFNILPAQVVTVNLLKLAQNVMKELLAAVAFLCTEIWTVSR